MMNCFGDPLISSLLILDRTNRKTSQRMRGFGKDSYLTENMRLTISRSASVAAASKSFLQA